VAATGLEVLAAIDRRPYDVVLMDLQMPEMDGLATTKEIHRRLPEGRRPRIVALTANARREDENACRAAGMDAFLPKPVNAERLRELLVQPSGAGRPAAPLDDDVFEQLRRLEDDAPGMLREIVDLYLADSPKRLDALRIAVFAGDVAGAAEQAHSLKGSSGYLGARELADLAAHVERLARAGNLEGLRLRAAELDDAFSRVREALVAATEE
jgi:CheY-like chemotaxis protein